MVSGAILFLKLLDFATEGKHSHAVLFPGSFALFLSSSLSEINCTVPACYQQRLFYVEEYFK